MPFRVSTRDVRAGDRTGTAYTLQGDNSRAVVWPTHGFNCLRWQVGADDLLFVAPDWDTNPVPTRSGHPVLFPFPNRLRAGSFNFRGTTYQLPLNESTGRHAIHGFTPRTPWRVIDSGGGPDAAFVTGEFQISKDAPHVVGCWPADARLRLTYRLSATALRVEAVVDAADGKELPFGLGYHPYFRAPGIQTSADGWVLTAHAATVWPAADGLPTGDRRPVPDELNFQKARPVGPVQLDTLYGTLAPVTRDNDPLEEVAALESPDGPNRLTVCVDRVFRDLLLFTPPHRQAVAIEPYTCATDAANLDARGIDAGWKVLAPGEVFRAAVEYRHEPKARPAV